MSERLIICDLPASGCQLHIHADATGNSIQAASLKTYDGETVRKLSPYEAAMADAHAQAVGLRRINR